MEKLLPEAWKPEKAVIRLDIEAVTTVVPGGL